MSDYSLDLEKFLENRSMNPAETLNFVSICDECYEAPRPSGKCDEGESDSADDSLKGKIYMPKKNVAVAVVEGLKKFLQDRGEKVDAFGVPKDGTFDNFFNAFDMVMQNDGGTDLYPEAEKKLATLFYFLIKNRYFADGNKRIASILLLWLMKMNNMISQVKSERTLTYGVVYKLSILVAESEAKDRKIVVQILSTIISTWKYPTIDYHPNL